MATFSSAHTLSVTNPQPAENNVRFDGLRRRSLLFNTGAMNDEPELRLNQLWGGQFD